MIGRFIGTIVAAFIYSIVNGLYTPLAMLANSKIANQQFDDSDESFATAVYGMKLVGGVHTLFLLLLILVLVLIWWKQLAGLAKGLLPVIMLIAAVGLLLSASPNKAFAFATFGDDHTEWFPVEPDEAAFLIPNFGATLSNQAQYQPDYLNGKDVKVPGKFILIPHGKLSGSGGSSGLSGWWGKDAFVNTSTLVLVKRSQYSRVWTQRGRGTHTEQDESFDCQTADGLNVKKIGVATVDLIDDKNAALYLSVYGQEPLDPKLDRTQIENVFISVRHARSLNSVTDDVGYANVHELVCHYIAAQPNPLVASGQMNQIMDSVKADYTQLMAAVGVTVKSIGWADSWTFDPDVQFAMNQKFNASMVKDVLDVLERNAAINLKEGLGNGFRDKMPNSLFWGAPELMNSAAVGAAAKQTETTPPAVPSK